MKQFSILLLLLTSFISGFSQSSDALDGYVEQLKKSKASGGSETAFMSAGSDFLYGWDYYEAKNYPAAQNYFQDVLRRQPHNAFANYMVGICLLKQNDRYKTQQAQDYLKKAFEENANLKQRYSGEVLPVTQTASTLKAATGLQGYIESIKYSKATGGETTRMNTAGNSAFYGIGYFETNEYSSAATEFVLSLSKDAANPYVNYLAAVSLAAIGKTTEAATYFQTAIGGDGSLKNRYAADVAISKTKWEKLEALRTVKNVPSAKKTSGGPLIFGHYTCSQTVYNGPNTSPAFRADYKGYFELKADGTYRWLDNGGEGTYSYDAKTGRLTWLSGHFKTVGFKPSAFQSNGKSGQITVTYSDSYRWECGCAKK